MTLVEGAPQRSRRERAERGEQSDPASGDPTARRRAPLWAHLAGLAVVLIALIPVIGTDASFSADEGAAIVQAQSLADGGGWIVEHPMPEADPTGRLYPLELSHGGPDGVAPFAKHPLYALLLAGADRLGGIVAMILLSVAGTVAAAAAAAALANRIDPSLGRPAIWVVGLASPLLFDSYLVIAHSLGAAAVAAAVLVGVIALERRRAAVAAAAAPLILLAVLLRTEATLLAVALALVAGVVGLRHPDRRRPAFTLAASAFGAAVAARILEQGWATSIMGGAAVSTAPPRIDPYGLVDGRLNALVITWLRPSYDGPRLLDLALILMMAGIALGAFVARRRPEDRAGLTVAAALAVVGMVGGILVAPHNLVPGLLPAFPLGLAGLLLIGRDTLQTLTAKTLFGTFALFAAAVIATQYSSGGTAEWGGRYFAIGLPLLVPVALAALRSAGARIGSVSSRATRPAIVALVVCSVGMAAMSLASIRSTHRFTADLMSQIERAGRATVTGEERPVMVATSGAIPRLAWATFDRQRWLLVPPDDLGTTMDRLRRLGVDRLTFVTRDEPAERPKLADTVQVMGTTPTPGNGWAILTLSLS